MDLIHFSAFFTRHAAPGKDSRPFAGARLWLPLAGLTLLLILALTPGPVRAQQTGAGSVLLDSNEQIFCVLAALNAAGYDTGLSAKTEDPTRDEVRTALERKKIPTLTELSKFYAAHHITGDPGADLGQYLSLSLLLGPPPEFKLTVPEANLPPDARRVVGLLPLLRRFYSEADLLPLWAQVQPHYRAAVERASGPVRQSIALTDAYFRFPSGGYLGRTYAIYEDLLGAPEQVQARIYGMNYYLVVTPSRDLKVNEIRHQYLHFLLDPLAVKYAPEIHQKIELKAVAYQAPALAQDFKEDFPLLVTECLIRAAELRMDKRPVAEAQKTVGELTAAGLILTPYFYEALGKFELQETSMMVYYKPMILGIDARAEEQRLGPVKYTVPAAAVAVTEKPVPVVSEEERMTEQGNNFIYRGRYAEAKATFQEVLEKLNPKSERALFGMAVIASNTRKPDLAEEYFRKTLDAAQDLRLVTWSHIYLGRLYDVEGKRDQALGEYKAASLTATAFPEALRAVEGGLQRPFGTKPRE